MLDRNENLKTTSSETNFSDIRLIVFQPGSTFYEEPFDVRLQILEGQIQKAAHYLSEQTDSSKLKWMFVAPEYLFKDFSKTTVDRYYSQEQKKKFTARLSELSKQYPNMVIVPGTFCWKKENRFRNSAYLFHNGQFERYKKTKPSLSDYDYLSGTTVSLGDARLKFFNKDGKNPNSPIKITNDLIIGIDICLDNKYLIAQHTFLQQFKDKKMTVQLVIADGLKEERYMEQPNLLFAHIERQEKDSLIGIVKETDFPPIPTQIEQPSPSDIDVIDENLRVYRFK